ncbi:hypothetical protein HELRODRAFT_72217 [Helobdella robusta]|uniref:Ionotropic glutamate receptor L-glutamate and glycine-binding domain-containing protein n=1 Tax=Helobdella robusta TaxID=6412 RepID=T1G0X4_HELRO|nr:hypothetical protein HELRODRAFT_72217 [Helobdella robusta]ESO11012.1 hypothetical protein HELRODRAFT_72217 [Helobdella robusta]
MIDDYSPSPLSSSSFLPSSSKTSLNFQKNKTGKPRFYGYLPEMLQTMSEQMNFRYDYHLVADGSYGLVNGNGSWNGMIGELIRGEADIAVAPLLVIDNRKPYVDFTLPFLNCQTSILIRKNFKLKTIEDLLSQSDLKFGTIRRGVIPRSCKRSNDTTMKILWKRIQRHAPEVMTSTNEEGIEMVRRSKFAFLLPDVIGEYISGQKPCDLINIGPLPLAPKGFGFALPKHSPYLSAFNRVIRNLKKSGYLDRLKAKWWTPECLSDKFVTDSRLKSRSGKSGNALLRSGRPIIFGSSGVSSVFLAKSKWLLMDYCFNTIYLMTLFDLFKNYC